MQLKLFIRTLPVALAALALISPSRASNIVTDGGFESATVADYNGSIDGFWTVTHGSIGINSAATGNWSPHSGVNMVYLDDNTTVNTISQTLATVAGQSYTISYWVADTVPDALSVTFDGQSLFFGTAPVTGIIAPIDYKNYTFTATASTNSTVISFTGQWSTALLGSGTILDDVTVNPTIASAPEPATLAFTAAGLLWLSLRRLLKTPARRG
jgi:hypothetical protein